MIEIKQRKSCDNCRGFKGGAIARCDFGYGLESKRISGIVVSGKPNEPCPKPTTISDYFECSYNYRK